MRSEVLPIAIAISTTTIGRILSVLRLAIVLLGAFTLAWNSTAHKTITLIALRQLDDAKQAQLVSILRAHPHFDSHFAALMPDEVQAGDGDQQDLWITLHASIWADLVRRPNVEASAEYNHGTWHYINVPLFLTPEDEAALSELPVNMSRVWQPEMPADDMNVIQALQKSTSVPESDDATDEQKSVYLCWLMHLVGDIHQPMHSTALFSRVTFPRGDWGGNDIPLRRGRNLHSLWDGLLGYDGEIPAVRRTMLRLLSDTELRAAGERAAGSLDFSDWLDESHRLARDVAYQPSILAAVRAAEESGAELGKIDLPDAYYSTAGAAAKRWIVEAG